MDSYFIHTGTEQTGPFSIDVLKTKNVTKDTLVWKDGFKDWMKAGEIPELNVLFIKMPPPLNKEKQISGQNSSFPVLLKNKKIIGIAASFVIVVAVAFFLFTKDKKPQSIIAAVRDTAVIEPIKIEPQKDTTSGDTTNTLNVDSASLFITLNPTDSVQTNVTPKDSKFILPGMGGSEPQKNKTPKTITVKKTVEKKTKKPLPKKENPINYLSISGNFRKNLLLEAILEGYIQNRHQSVSFKNISIIVLLYNEEGTLVSEKKFFHRSLINPGESATFKFKTSAPKGAKTAKYKIRNAE